MVLQVQMHQSHHGLHRSASTGPYSNNETPALSPAAALALPSTDKLHDPTPRPSLEKLLVMRARMAARKQRLEQALQMASVHQQHLAEARRPLKKRRLTMVASTTSSIPLLPARRCRRKTRHATVRFNLEHNIVHDSRHLSLQDVNNAWLEKKDYKAIWAENRRTIQALGREGGNPHALDATQHCVRGLEIPIAIHLHRTCTQKKLQQYSRLVLTAATANADEHKRHLPDPEALRQVSLRLTKNDRIKAIQMAAADAFH